jgi:hypothetical protein
MHSQLQEIVDEFDSASRRLDQLVARVPLPEWSVRTHPDRWSAAECIEHLNLTSRAYLPLLDRMIDEAEALGSGAPRRYRRDPIGWLLWKTMGPPVRQRQRTIAAFVPGATLPPGELVAEFARLQQEQVNRVRRCDGLPVQAVRVQSPFAARVRYNGYSCLSILPLHQHRHLWQAEQLFPAS